MNKSIFINCNSSGSKPEYQTHASAGCDLHSAAEAIIEPGERLLVPTGLFLEIPNGFMGMVCPRSGLALKHGVTVLNSPGIIDSDYRGEVKVLLINHSRQKYSLKIGDRIAQLIFTPAMQAALIHRDTLSETQRGTNGFGSTGT